MTYPEGVPNAERIAQLKGFVNDRHNSMLALETKGREAYKEAMRQLNVMAECRDTAFDLLRQAAKEIQEIRNLLIEPKI